MTVRTRTAHADELERIAAFYSATGYQPTIGPTEVIFIAEDEGRLCGVFRLCAENGHLVLRGMRVADRMRRQGIGSQLLENVALLIGDRECFCIPLRHLQSFYNRIGFEVVDESEAPSFLKARCTLYRNEFGLDVIIMAKTG